MQQNRFGVHKTMQYLIVIPAFMEAVHRCIITELLLSDWHNMPVPQSNGGCSPTVDAR